jgi:hypothetical protein
MGFILGMFYQQIIFIEGAGKILSNTDIQINFNETRFVEEFSNKFIPTWKEAFNETLHNQLNLTNESKV